jgi:type IV pilus assembly protein PilY1
MNYSTSSSLGYAMKKNNNFATTNRWLRHLVNLKSLAYSLILTSTFTGLTNVSAAVDLAQSPILSLKTAPGLVMLTMGRDLPLYRAAYNDVNDIDGDNQPDIYFKPSFKYEGYFAYDRCYTSDKAVFTPVKIGDVVVNDANDVSKNSYKCPGQWSGNFLNWVTMARIDVLRKVLYGGKRSTDYVETSGDDENKSNKTKTILERTYVPQESTMWGKEYASKTRDGYDINDFTPLKESDLTNGSKHMFANVTLQGNDLIHSTTVGPPLMIVYENRPGRIWDLVSAENLILGANPGVNPAASATQGTKITQHIVRVEVCKIVSGSTKREDFCVGYPKNNPKYYKPTGLLHKYGETKTLAFGLLSGTYDNNYAGGVLRQNIDDFNREVNASTGQFVGGANGIVHHLSAFRPWGFGQRALNDDTSGTWGGINYLGWNFKSIPVNGENPSWGNPLGEMMFETLNYFSGGSPSAAFTAGVGADQPARVITVPSNGNYTIPAHVSPETPLALKRPDWLNPYTAVASDKRLNAAAYPSCARPLQMTIGDPKTSFDSDHFANGPTVDNENGTNTKVSLGSLDVVTQGQAIWDAEGLGTKTYFIGEVNGTLQNDKNPTAKTVTSFGNIRGHGPDATANQGSFYGASVARYGKVTGVSNTAAGNLKVDQISIALDSHIPQIKIPMANNKVVSILLTSKSVASPAAFGISRSKDASQGTGAITAFFIDQIANTNADNKNNAINGGNPYYKFRVSFSDIDQGGDNESDAKITYEIKLNGPVDTTVTPAVSSATELTIGMDYFSSTTGIEMHEGYIIGGTTKDGLYLDVAGGQGFGNPPPAATVGYYLDTMPGFDTGSVDPGSALASGTAPYTNITTRLPLSTLAAPRKFFPGPSGTGEFIPHDMLWYAAKYGSSGKLKANNIDPENYYYVNNPSTLAAQLGQAFQKAASLGIATSSAVGSSGVKVSGGNLVYQASFDSNRWGGELRAFAVLGNGNIDDNATWKATVQQPAPKDRNVVVGLASVTNPKLKSPSVNATSFGTLTAGAATFTDDATFRYLLGDRTKEQGGAGTGKFRERSSAVGDFVNSDPLYVGKSDFGYTGAGYATFKAASDPQLIAIGSNDGFYRLLDASTGAEKVAFIPATTAGKMIKLADPEYTHEYFVDGPSAFGHANFGTNASPNWNAVVASSFGAGAKGLFALNASAANLATSNNAVLWELNENDSSVGDKIGNILNKPVVAHLTGATGKAMVLVGNGINSANDKASLLVINAETGALEKHCTPTDAANSAGNGMSSIVAISDNKDGKIDSVYAADYRGNVWRIDPNQTGALCSSSAIKVFTAKDAAGKLQPITGDMTVITAPSPKTGNMILFGTGKLSSVSDTSNKDPQTLYGVWDAYTTTSTSGALRADLVDYPFVNYNATKKLRAASKQSDVNGGKTWFDTAGKKGWMIDLSCTGCPAGERFLDKPLIAGSATTPVAYFLSYVPGDDPCKPGGDGWVTGIDPTTGDFENAFAKLNDDNSVFVGGAAPRGLFIATTAASGGKPGAEYIYISVNGDPGTNASSGIGSSSSDVSGGKTTAGSDTISNIGIEVTPKVPPSPALGRRLVWRQIQ